MSALDDSPLHYSAEEIGDTLSRRGQLQATVLNSYGLDDLPAPEALIDGILYRDTLAWLHGKPGCGKSFIALDWAGCVSTGLPWQDRVVTLGPVLIVVDTQARVTVGADENSARDMGELVAAADRLRQAHEGSELTLETAHQVRRLVTHAGGLARVTLHGRTMFLTGIPRRAHSERSGCRGRQMPGADQLRLWDGRRSPEGGGARAHRPWGGDPRGGSDA
jgi:hypothetical protein